MRYSLRVSQFLYTFAANFKPSNEGLHARMKREHKHKSPESAAREKAHQFGQPGGNPIGNSSNAINQREFYRWAESKASKAELEQYRDDETKPWARRHFCELLLSQTDMDDMFALTNQTHGAPKQPIEVQSLPQVVCEFFGDE